MKKYPPSIRDFINFNGRGGVFFIHCPERYVLKAMRTELFELIDKNGGEEFFSFDMTEEKSALGEAINSAREISLFSSKRIVVLELSEKLSDKEQKLLESYVDCCETLNYLIVFIAEIDKRTKFAKNLQKLEKIYFAVPLPTILDLKNFIKNEFKPLLPDERSTEFFLESANRDMFFIHNEIEKLKLYAESRGLKEITFSQALNIVNDLSEQALFKIMELLIAKRRDQALKLYRETIVAENEQAVNSILISMFFKYFKALMKGRIFIREGRTSSFFSYISQNRLFYMKNNAAALADSYKNRTVLKALKNLAEIEMGMKGALNSQFTETTAELEIFMVNFF